MTAITAIISKKLSCLAPVRHVNSGHESRTLVIEDCISEYSTSSAKSIGLSYARVFMFQNASSSYHFQSMRLYYHFNSSDLCASPITTFVSTANSCRSLTRKLKLQRTYIHGDQSSMTRSDFTDLAMNVIHRNTNVGLIFSS